MRYDKSFRFKEQIENKMIICVSGVPGTGKTSIAKMLSKKYKLKYLEGDKFIQKNKLRKSWDKRLRTWNVNTNKLNKALIKVIKKEKNLIIDSHLSHYLPRKYVDLCILVKCNPKVLRKRLEKRKYHDEKIKHNIDAEIFDVCLNEAKENKHRIKIIDTTTLKIKQIEKLL